MVFRSYASAFRGLGKIFQFENVITGKTRSENSKYLRSISSSEKTWNMTRETADENRNVMRGATAMKFVRLQETEEINERFESNISTSEDSRSSELEEISNSEEVKMPDALERCDKDLSDLAPWTTGSFNFAAYANDSQTIQELAKLRVDLHKVEKRPNAMELLLKHSFDELKPHIRFLHDCGINANNLGAFITKNPYIFSQTIDDLTTRIRYLRAHNFKPEMIARIVEKNPYWLMFSTERIDNRLGHFQREYNLSGTNIRYLTTKQPKLITYSFQKLQAITFAIKEEMGFSLDEMKVILLDKPRIFMKNREKLVELFDYVHNTMKLPHEIIMKQPIILTCRIERIRPRHEYLEALGKTQYDPTQPMYISPLALVTGSDLDFCRDVAKTTLETYNLFLKTR